MDKVTLEGFGRTEDRVPVFAYTARLQDGRDLDGTFDVQLAAIEDGGEVKFAVLDRQHNVLGRWKWSPGVKGLLDAILDYGGFKAAINYENTSWNEGISGTAFMVMPGSLGAEYDVVQDHDLTRGDLEQVRQIRAALEQREGETA